jgi:hypothetical protein
VRPGRTSALVTLSVGGAAAVAAWGLLVWELLAWEAPRVSVTPPLAGTVLPRVEVVRVRAELPAAATAQAAAASAQATAAPAAQTAAASAPAAQRRLEELLATVHAQVDAVREPVRARTTGTAPPRIPLPQDVVTCGGLRARDVTRVAYLIDCSARSEPHIADMVDAVMRSAARLGDAQSFVVVACRKDWAEVAPPGAMRRGGAAFGSSVAADLRAWLRDNASPGGSPQIYAGIEAAMASRPDLVVLVSAGLANPGDADDVRDAALAAVERANPRDARTGARRARIMTLVAGGQDPRGVMSSIASAHARGAALHGVLDGAAPGLAGRHVTPPSDTGAAAGPPGRDTSGAAGVADDLDARMVEAVRRALADPSDPASARALLEAAVLADSMGWPRDHVARLATAAMRRADALGLDQMAADAARLAAQAREGTPQ